MTRAAATALTRSRFDRRADRGLLCDVPLRAPASYERRSHGRSLRIDDLPVPLVGGHSYDL
jgi:hypothetical protein